MTNERIEQQRQEFWDVRDAVIKETGKSEHYLYQEIHNCSSNAAVMAERMVLYSPLGDTGDDWCYDNYKDFQKMTRLTRQQQRRARASLRATMHLKEMLKPSPRDYRPTVHWKLDLVWLKWAWESYLKDVTGTPLSGKTQRLREPSVVSSPVSHGDTETRLHAETEFPEDTETQPMSRGDNALVVEEVHNEPGLVVQKEHVISDRPSLKRKVFKAVPNFKTQGLKSEELQALQPFNVERVAERAYRLELMDGVNTYTTPAHAAQLAECWLTDSEMVRYNIDWVYAKDNKKIKNKYLCATAVVNSAFDTCTLKNAAGRLPVKPPTSIDCPAWFD